MTRRSTGTRRSAPVAPSATASAEWQAGWYARARTVASPNFGTRPQGVTIDLAVIHSISLPPGVYGGDAIERFFTNRLAPHKHPYFAQIAGLQVSAHFLIRRDGALLQFVSVTDRAWHAGASCWQGRDNCNDYAVGIELEGLEGDLFEPAQYATLAALLRGLRQEWPIAQAVGHEHVAPGRKLDPGPGFDWTALATALRGSGICLPASTP